MHARRLMHNPDVGSRPTCWFINQHNSCSMERRYAYNLSPLTGIRIIRDDVEPYRMRVGSQANM